MNGEITFGELTSLEDGLLLPWLDLYETAFPPYEKVLVSHFLSLLKSKNSDQGKAEFVLRAQEPKDWYWLEDPLHKCESDALVAAGKLDRYISVDPTGPWGFLNAVKELFRRSGKTADDVELAGGRPEWFDGTAIPAGDMPSKQRKS